MDDLAAQIRQILADPGQMAQIAQLADSLGLDGGASPQEDAPQEDVAFSADALGRLLPLLSRAGGRETQIFGALRPYLKAEDQARVDRALRAAKLSRLAKLAISELGSGALGGLL